MFTAPVREGFIAGPVSQAYSSAAVCKRGLFRAHPELEGQEMDYFHVGQGTDGKFYYVVYSDAPKMQTKPPKSVKPAKPKKDRSIVSHAGSNALIADAIKRDPELAAIAKAPKQGGRNRSTITRGDGTRGPVFVVWDTCDKMVGARRKDVVAACIAKGVTPNTARTQYQYWFTARKAAK